TRRSSDLVLAVPDAVVIVLIGIPSAKKGREMLVVKQIQLEMHMSALFADTLARVARAAHHGDLLAPVDSLAGMKSGPRFEQMGIKGVNLNAINHVTQDNIIAVIGKGRARVDIHDNAIVGGEDGIGRLAMAVALEAFDVEAFMNLPASRAHAAEHAGGVRLAGRADKETRLAARLQEGVIGGGKSKWLRVERDSKAPEGGGDKAFHGGARRLTGRRIS